MEVNLFWELHYMSNNLVPTGKAAEILGVSKSTLYRMLDQGVITTIRTIGGQRRFNILDLEEFKRKNTNIGLTTELLKDTSSSTDINKNLDLSSDKEEKSVDKRNTLNELTGSQWLPLTKSFLYQKGLGAKHPHAQIEKQHPAPYSFQDISQLILFFTKKGMNVLDPFGGVGSTAKACALEGRICTSIELQEKWNNLAKERLDFEVFKGASEGHSFLQGNAINILPTINDSSFDFIVTSPPYWSILNKKADHKVKQERIKYNLSTNYSNDEDDLGNIPDYEDFLDILVNKIFVECGRVLKPKKYMCIVVSDFRNKSEFISFHSDLIQRLNNKKTKDGYLINLQGVKVLIQNHKSLLPYGYPFAYVENIHHQYILIFRKG